MGKRVFVAVYFLAFTSLAPASQTERANMEVTYRGKTVRYWRDALSSYKTERQRSNSPLWEGAPFFLKDDKEVDENALPLLIALLSDSDLDVRIEVLLCMQPFGKKASPASNAVARILDRADDYVEIRESILSLARIGPNASSALPRLRRIMESSGEHALEAAQAIRAISPRERLLNSVLLEKLSNARAGGRVTCVDLLSVYLPESGPLFAIFSKSLADEREPADLRCAIAKSFGTVSILEQRRKAELVLRRCLKSGDCWFTLTCAESLWKLSNGQQPCIDIYAEALTHRDDPALLFRAISGLSERRAYFTPAIIQSLAEIQSDDENMWEYVQKKAREVLSGSQK